MARELHRARACARTGLTKAIRQCLLHTPALGSTAVDYQRSPVQPLCGIRPTRSFLQRLKPVFIHGISDGRSGDPMTKLSELALIRSYPHSRFSKAKRTTRFRISCITLGRPGFLAQLPSYLLAISFRCHRIIVSGVTMQLISVSTFRPSALPSTANPRR